MSENKMRVDLRLDPQMHARLTRLAKADSRSLHSLVVSILNRWLAGQEEGDDTS